MAIVSDILLFLMELVQLIVGICAGFLRSLWQHIVPPGRKSVQGQVVLVTGAAQGIGREIALEFGLRGARLALVDINTTKLTATVQEFRRIGFEASACQCDVSDFDDVTKMASAVNKVFGHVDILVNNAGVLSAQTLLELSPARIQKTLDINLKAHFWTTKNFLPKMTENGSGHIVNIASIAGKITSPRLTDYAASKHGVVGFSDALRDELRSMGHPDIHVTTVCPWFVNTGMIDMGHAECVPRFDPILEPNRVAKVTVDGVLRNYETIYIPWRLSILLALCRIFPSSVVDLVRNFTQAGFAQKNKTPVTNFGADEHDIHNNDTGDIRLSKIQ